MENKDKPAYPSPIAGCTDGGVYPVQEVDNNLGGLTKREMFAMAVTQGLCANPNVSSDKTQKDTAQFYATCAINIADELLKQLEP